MKSFEEILKAVSLAKGLTKEARLLKDEISSLPSGHPDKKRGTKYFLEPLKLLLINEGRMRDPLFAPHELTVFEGEDDFGPDYWWRKRTEVDWKYVDTTFEDPIWGCVKGFGTVPISQYVALSARQWERYRLHKPETNLLIERNITNFDPETKIGLRNLEAFDYAKLPLEPFWGYARLSIRETLSWVVGIDYFHSISNINSPKGCTMTVFRFDRCAKYFDYTEKIPEARSAGVLL